MRKTLLVISALALAVSAAYADPLADRKALMKANGAAIGALNRMVKGDVAFDAAEALAQLTKLKEDAEQMDPAVLWPEGSGTGDTKSSPKIWEDAAGFQAAIDKFRADTAAAVAAAPQDAQALGQQFGTIASNCGTCHQAYRL